MEKPLAPWAVCRHNPDALKRAVLDLSAVQKGTVLTTPDAEEAKPIKGLRNSRRARVRLDSMQRVRRELTRIYGEARDGLRDVSDASKLGNMLGTLGRLIEGGDLERRIEALEARR